MKTEKTRAHLKLGSWNFWILVDSCQRDRPGQRSANIAQELDRIRIDVDALSETRLADKGQIFEIRFDYTFFWRGKPVK